jgi:hypothetical protein
VVELANRAVEAAWKIRNLEDYDARLERAAHRVEELAREHETAALVIYEGALAKSGRPQEEIRELVRSFRDTFEDEEEPLTIPRLSALLNVEDDSWFFGDENLRVLTGRMLGQFQHRVAQYNYVAEREVLKRWADGYDTRLFIRRRIHDTEPVVGVLEAFDLRLIQYLRLISGANTLVPSENVARSLEALGYDDAADDHAVLARAEELALHLELPAPVVGEMLEDLAREGRTDFPEPPREAAQSEEPAEDAGDEASDEGVASEGGEVEGGAAAEAREEKPSPEDRADRTATGEDPGRGEEPTRVQDPQSKDAPGVDQEAGDVKDPEAPETGRGGAPDNPDREDDA